MITFLNGSLVEKQPTRVVMDVGGVGYEVLIPLSSYDSLPSVGGTCRVLTYDYVREDSHQLFGFMTGAERELFVLLLGISGIGPKLALSALSGMSVRELKAAVLDGDIKRISSISGLGKKTAERLIVELRHKLSAADALEASASGPMSDGEVRTRDAVMALMALGYKQEAARKMVTTALKTIGDGDSSVERIIKLALGR